MSRENQETGEPQSERANKFGLCADCLRQLEKCGDGKNVLLCARCSEKVSTFNHSADQVVDPVVFPAEKKSKLISIKVWCNDCQKTFTIKDWKSWVPAPMYGACPECETKPPKNQITCEVCDEKFDVYYKGKLVEPSFLNVFPKICNRCQDTRSGISESLERHQEPATFKEILEAVDRIEKIVGPRRVVFCGTYPRLSISSAYICPMTAKAHSQCVVYQIRKDNFEGFPAFSIEESLLPAEKLDLIVYGRMFDAIEGIRAKWLVS